MYQPLIQFNHGRVDPLSLARVDQKRVAISADIMTNWIPRVLGPMSLRPGLEYITSTYTDAEAKYIPFIFANDDTALIEITAGWIRVLVDETPITRPTVTTAVANGDFDTNIASWTDSSDAGGSLSWSITTAMVIEGDGSDFGIADQEVTVNETGTEHALRVVITRGPVEFQVGSTSGGDQYITKTTLGTGEHSLACTPTGNLFIRMQSSLKRAVFIDSVNIESSGIITLPNPWTDLTLLRWDQSADVIYIASAGFQQRKIERRGERSWSIVTYQPDDGPFKIENVGPITVTPSALSGNTTLTASKPLFTQGNIGGLYQVTSSGQEVISELSAEDTFTDAIKVTGITSDRIFTIVLDGISNSTINLQRSLTAETGPWSDVPNMAFNADITRTFDDGLDNQIVWYRIGIKTGSYGSDTVTATLGISTGSIVGVCRVTAYASTTSVSVEVIKDFGGTDATDVWREGQWSDRRGWPSSVSLHEGRLWWAGKDRIIGSISDSYEQFDPDFEGDAGPINRTIGSGPVDSINWALSLQRLLLGGEGAEHSIRSSSFDEPITPSDFMLRQASSQGSASVPAVKIDQKAMYVQRSGLRIYELSFGAQVDYDSSDLTLLVPEMGSPGLIGLAVQRQPDTRIHAIRSDGTVMLGVLDRDEEVLAWIDIETDGTIEDVVVLPGTNEDDVYYVVQRTIDGDIVRYLEKFAQETECRGGTLNKQADAFTTYTGAATDTITGLDHLEGEEVVVWAAGEDVGTDTDYTQLYTVVNGQVVLASAATNAVVGLPYTAQFESAKLQGANVVDALTTKKRIDRIGLLLSWVHPKGLRYGQDFDNLEDMPEVEAGVTIDADTIRDEYFEDPIIVPGYWKVDTRLCLQAQAPRPCTVMAAIPDIDTGG